MTTALPRTAGTVTTAEGPSCDSRCLGVDIGGTNIKSAVVDVSDGALITLGTGIGSALIVNGHLVPNTELGHLEIDGPDGCPRIAGLTDVGRTERSPRPRSVP